MAGCCIISFLYIKPQLEKSSLPSVRVVLYRFSTSNHNRVSSNPFMSTLYYIVSLHQTTTAQGLSPQWPRLYYIVSLHQTTTLALVINQGFRCIISFLYIKPQRSHTKHSISISCIISFLYIKPQRSTMGYKLAGCCIISFLYIKPQPI